MTPQAQQALLTLTQLAEEFTPAARKAAGVVPPLHSVFARVRQSWEARQNRKRIENALACLTRGDGALVLLTLMSLDSLKGDLRFNADLHGFRESAWTKRAASACWKQADKLEHILPALRSGAFPAASLRN